jgi:hypothetical protein
MATVADYSVVIVGSLEVGPPDHKELTLHIDPHINVAGHSVLSYSVTPKGSGIDYLIKVSSSGGTATGTLVESTVLPAGSMQMRQVIIPPHVLTNGSNILRFETTTGTGGYFNDMVLMYQSDTP